MDFNAIIDMATEFSSTSQGRALIDAFDFIFNLLFPANSDPATWE